MFPKAVGIIYCFAMLSRGGEQFASGVRLRRRLPTHPYNKSKLRLIKQIELAEHFCKQGAVNRSGGKQVSKE